MGLDKLELKNKGMSQDLAISTDTSEYAYENYNIRIQAFEDSTLVSITNIKGPEKVILNESIKGHLVGKCKCHDALVLFTKADVDYIYKIDFATNTVVELYSGDLNFKDDHFIDSIFYYENASVQKVYFVDGVNKPRVINIMAEKLDSNDLEFFPAIGSLPKLQVEKDYSILSELPCGTIQYFVSYYNINGAETLIANSSSVFTIDLLKRGGKADETGKCGFKITLTNLNKDFDRIRVYSAIRTTQEGALLVKIVGDYDIKSNPDKETPDTLTIIDNGVNQETIEPSQLFYVGGTPFIAGTIAQKDGTAFFGNLEINSLDIPSDIKRYFEVNGKDHEVKDDDEHWWSNDIEFTDKEFSLLPNDFNTNYRYRRQTFQESLKYKTFKALEIYRFGIQFQNAEGQWTPVLWIGDKKCETFPRYDEATYTMHLNNAEFSMPEEIKVMCKNAGYENYRIVIADPERQNGRSILAQGLVCPTMFTPGQRAMNAPYNLSSWIMRPREGNVACHHFEPLNAAEEESGAELWLYQLGDNPDSQVDADKYNHYTYPYEFIGKEDSLDSLNTPEYLVTFFFLDSNFVSARTVKFKSDCLDSNFNDLDGAINVGQAKPSNEGNYATVVFDRTTNYHAYNQMDKKWYEDFRNDMVNHFQDFNLDASSIPSLEAIRTLGELIHKEKVEISTGWLAAMGAILGAIASACAIPFTAGTSAAGAGGLIAAACAVIATTCAVYSGLYLDKGYKATVSDYGLSQNPNWPNWVNQLSTAESWQKEFYLNNYYCFKRGHTLVFGRGDDPGDGTLNNGVSIGRFDPKVFMPVEFFTMNERPSVQGSTEHQVCFISISTVPSISKQDELRKKQMYEYFIDESTVSFHTPFVEELGLDNEDAKFRIVGIAPIDNTYSDFDMNVTHPYLGKETIITDKFDEYHSDMNLLTGDYLYLGPGYLTDLNPSPSQSDKEKEENPNGLGKHYAKWKVFMFDKTGSLVGADGSTEVLDSFKVTQNGLPDLIQDKQFYNHQFSYFTKYLSQDKDRIKYSPSTIKLFTGDTDSVQLLTKTQSHMYYGNYSTLATAYKEGNDPTLKNFHKLVTTDDEIVKPLVDFPVDIRFNSNSHLVFELSTSDTERDILPYFENREKYTGLDSRKESYGVGWAGGNDVPSDTIDCWTKDFNLHYEDAYFIPISVFEWNKWDTNNLGFYKPTSRRDFPGFTYVDDADHQIYGSTLYNQQIERYESLIRELMDEIYDRLKDGHKFGDPQIQAYNQDIKNLQALIEEEQNKPNSYRFYTIAEFLTEYLTYREKSDIKLNFLDKGKPLILGINLAQFTVIKNTIPKRKLVKTGNYYTKLKITSYNLITEGPTKGVINNVSFEGSYNDDNEVFLVKNTLGRRIKYTRDYGTEPYTDFPIKYTAPLISEDITALKNGLPEPYIFIGELYKDIKHKDLYGGYDPTQLENLIWIPCSAVTPIDDPVEIMEGDTYFQRWDCLKTFPHTDENFENKVVDITSCMLESHYNLDERTDVNRANFNKVVRPRNFDLYNPAYNFKNNIFTYAVDDNPLQSNLHRNQFTWSLAKNYLGRVDTWTNVALTAIGECEYPITKLVNSNNNMLALTEHSLEIINFNAKNLINGGDGTFIELANNNKVDGTIKTKYSYGTHNASVLDTEKGLYYIDDNTKSLMLLSEQGVLRVGDTQLDRWFKQNTVQGTYVYANQSPFHLEYDAIHKDVYILNDNYCLIFNEKLGVFTSFIDFQDTYTMYDFNGKIYSVAHIGNPQLYDLFGGEYNTTYDGQMIDYSMQYRVTPAPLGDKVFTNVEFIADCTVDDLNSKKSDTKPFNFIRAWNEYQDTEVQPLQFERDYVSNLKQKFRVWRALIPRDANSQFKRDRIRNPWIHLVLGRNNSDGVKEKMEMHYLDVQFIK